MNAEDNPPKPEEPRRTDNTDPRPSTNPSQSRSIYADQSPQYVSSSYNSGSIGRSYSRSGSSGGSLSFSGGRTSSSGGGGYLALQ